MVKIQHYLLCTVKHLPLAHLVWVALLMVAHLVCMVEHLVWVALLMVAHLVCTVEHLVVHLIVVVPPPMEASMIMNIT